jgi:hypothetical protein
VRWKRLVPGPDGVDRGIVEFKVAQHCFEIAAPERLADDERRQHDEADPGDRGVPQHIPVIDAEPCRPHPEASPLAADAKSPFIGDRAVPVEKTIVAVIFELFRRARLATRLQIGGARANHMAAGR